ncbi:hypothetical protein A3D71_02545 [Candidatus Kaiserbacteria bacterium RIFCSPHIGHO2_02_FULL_55_20]|uniref:Uncharacterized protein n=1 Tax=Candidatus Kaiserbacteria bacterium RIFCSPHIGHO2_02_FULL_55_20 TaxID=1798497 RepID=A0A1F6DYC2_9BACT|nr:MAG: hypothetical protein A2680_00870 [Candidatus Kaiserbacteria bacterium RIFCSPHIGHO2_01_FULL_55_37]OGG66425.1 MAG: hypothetical protein A3D71_02545 [Candidatus Kaiserbacteria bacterium RIFCSPHIGHO2_02_FULL_55_20]
MVNEDKLKTHLIGYKANNVGVKRKTENALRDIEQEISELAREKKDVLEQYAKGLLKRDIYGKKCDEYDQKIDAEKSERNKLLSTVPALHKKSVIDESVGKYCGSLKNRLEKCADFNARRQLLLDYLYKITFARGRVELHGSIPMHLDAYLDPEQTSEAKETKFVIASKIK